MLDDLVHSLAPVEKRYVSVSLARFKIDSEYLKVFNAILDAGSHPARLAGEELSAHTPVVKVQLYWKILRLLQDYKSASHPEIQKNDLLSQCLILEEKGLSQQALKVLNRLSELCRKHDFIDDLLYIERKRIRILTASADLEKKEHHLSAFKKESLVAIKAITQLNTLLNVYYQNKLNLRFSSLNIDLNAVNIINSYVNALRENELLSDNAAFFYHFNKSIYYLLTKQVTKGLHHLGITLNNLFGSGTRKAFYSVHQSDILDVMFELVYVNQVDALFKEMIGEVGSRLVKAKGDMNAFSLFKLETECYLNWKNEDPKAFTLSCQRLQKFIHEKKDDAFKTSLPLNTVRLLIEQGQHKKCWFYLHNITKAESRSLRFETLVVFKLAGLLLAVTLGDSLLVRSEIRTLRAFSGNTGIDSNFFSSTLSLVENVAKASRKRGGAKAAWIEFERGFLQLLDENDYQANYRKMLNFKKLLSPSYNLNSKE